MIDEFQAENTMNSQLRIIIVNARGKDERRVDAGSVYHDGFQSSEWSADGTIFTKGYLVLGCFPYMLSQAFILSVIFGENAVPEETLQKSFQNYIANDEQEVVAGALKGDLDVEGLINVLDRFGGRAPPTHVVRGPASETLPLPLGEFCSNIPFGSLGQGDSKSGCMQLISCCM